VIAGTGAQSTRETIQLCKEAKAAGATFALVLTPCTWVPAMTREAVLTFHRTVADGSPIPTMVYNFPTVTAGQNLTSDIIDELAQHPNIVGTKLSCGDIGKMHRLTTTYRKDGEGAKKYGEFATFPGKSDVYFAGLMLGSAGIIGALVNIAPGLHVRLLQLFREDKLVEAIKIQELLSHADASLGKVGGIGAIKTACREYFGYGTACVRGPLMSPPRQKVMDGSEYSEWIRKSVEAEKALNL